MAILDKTPSFGFFFFFKETKKHKFLCRLKLKISSMKLIELYVSWFGYPC